MSYWKNSSYINYNLGPIHVNYYIVGSSKNYANEIIVQRIITLDTLHTHRNKEKIDTYNFLLVKKLFYQLS